MIVHLVLAKLRGQLVRDHVTLERPVHKMHCNCELIPAQMILDDLFREVGIKSLQTYLGSHPCPDRLNPISCPALTLAALIPS